MKFGKKMIAAMRPEWGPHVYVPYESLKRTLLSLAHAETAAQAEGDFVAQLMQCLQQVNSFYSGREVDCALRLRRLAKALESPSLWMPAVAEVVRLSSEGMEVSLAALLPQLTLLDQEHAAALREFVDLCGELDLLRKYAMLNYLAVVKIVKKHDKNSPLRLREAFATLVTVQPFYTSTQLAATFTHAQCIQAELISAASGATMAPERSDYSCPICMEVLRMPVVLACTHRFCHGCLATACEYGNHCPLCMKETDLDPEGYEVDPVLTRFVAAHFARPKPASPDKAHASPSSSEITEIAEIARLIKPGQPGATKAFADGADAAADAGADAAAATGPVAATKRPRADEALGGADTPLVKKRGACTECYKAKAACVSSRLHGGDDGPCTRCTRLGRECLPHVRQRRRRRLGTSDLGCAAAAPSPPSPAQHQSDVPMQAAHAQAHPAPSVPLCTSPRGGEAEPDHFTPDHEIEDELDISSDLLLSLSPAGPHPFLSLDPKDMESLLGDLEQIST